METGTNGTTETGRQRKDPSDHTHDGQLGSDSILSAVPVVAVAVPFQSTVQFPFPESVASVTA